MPDLTLEAHLAELSAALSGFRLTAGRLARWADELAAAFSRGGKLLVAGNGGSAAEAQHLVAELVGKLRDDRAPLAAIALTADTCTMTAVSNDYGYPEVFARQVHAYGRRNDALLLISTSGGSPNLLTAAAAGTSLGMKVLAFTGPAPNPLAQRCREVLAVPATDPQVVQELHLISTHLLCQQLERALAGPAIRHRLNGHRVDGAAVPVDARRRT